MNQNYLNPNRYALSFILLVSFVFLSACGGSSVEYPAEEPIEVPAVEEPMEVPAAEEPMEEPAAEAPMEEPLEPATLRIALPAYSGVQELPNYIFETFMEMYPDINLEWIYIPSYDYSTKIGIMMAAGDLPNIVILGYNDIAELQAYGSLYALDEMNWLRGVDFIPSAIESNTFHGEMYGVPWLRAGCSPNYQNLAVVRIDDRAEWNAISALFEYLVSDEVLIENFYQLEWFPTRASIYDQIGLVCEQVQALYLQPEFVAITKTYVTKTVMANLEDVLAGTYLSPEYAAAYYVGDEALANAAPVKGSPPEDYAWDALSGDGLLLGSLSVFDYVEGIPIGDYAVWCFETQGEAVCEMRSPDRLAFQIKPSTFETSQGPAGVSTCVVEQGSRKMCWYIDGLKFCVTVG